MFSEIRIAFPFNLLLCKVFFLYETPARREPLSADSERKSGIHGAIPGIYIRELISDCDADFRTLQEKCGKQLVRYW